LKKIIISSLLLINSLISKEVEVDLNKAIDLAIQNNAMNRISKLNLQMADAQYQQALSANYPSLDAIFYANRDKNDTIFQQRGYFTLSSEYSKIFALANTLNIPAGAARDAAQATISAMPANAFPQGQINADIDSIAKGRDTVVGQLEVNYPLYTGGKISSIIEQARLNKDIKREAINRDENSVVYDVKKYFYGYVLTNELYNLVDGIYSNMKFSRDLTKDFLENGTSLEIKKTDYLNIKLLTSLIESTRAKIDLNRKMLEGAIANVMGLKYNDTIKIVYEEQKILKQNIALQELVKEAMRLNPDVKTINLALKIKDEQIKEKKADYYPMVNVFGNISHTYNSYEYGYLNEDDENRWSIGLAVKMNLFNGFKTKNEVIEKRVDKSIINEKKLFLEDAVALQLKNEFIKSSIGFNQVQILKDAVKTAKENSKMNFKGYQYEMVEARDLVQSQLMEVYVKSDYLKNVHDYLLSLATIDKLVGREIENQTY